MIRVMVAEDMSFLREAVVLLLGQEPDIEVVATAERGDEVLALMLESRPGVLVLDIGMPGMDGLEVAEQCRSTAPETAVLMLTALEKPGIVRRALVAGARGFLPKGVSIAELAEAIRRVHHGDIVVSTELNARVLAVGANPLTERERDVLRIAWEGLPARVIAGRLVLSVGTVRNHMTHAISKLHALNTIDAARKADELGWL